jgi:hypothetical protein
MLGLVTFFLLGAFTLIYVSKIIKDKPDMLEKAVEVLNTNVEKIALGSLAYALIAAFLTPVVVFRASDMVVQLFANLLLIGMALPYGFDRLTEKYGARMNAAILEELRGMVGLVRRKETLFGLVGGATTLVLFVILFR